MPKPEFSPSYRSMRNRLFSLRPGQIRPLPPLAGGPLAVVFENGTEEGVVTLLGVADGCCSIYRSDGGAEIGLQGHPGVHAAVVRWLRVAAETIPHLARTPAAPLPASGSIRVHVVTADGIRSGKATREELRVEGHRLAPLVYAASQVFAAIPKFSNEPTPMWGVRR